MRQLQLKNYWVSRFNSQPSRPEARLYFSVRRVWRQLRTRSVPLDSILCGGEHGLDGQQFSRHSGDLQRTSNPICQSPHSKLLKQYQQIGDRLFDPILFKETEYYINASNCLKLFGIYFSVTDESQIINLAKNLIAQWKGTNTKIDLFGPSTAYSQRDQPICVFPIQYSNCYQVFDGNHRLAIACARGERSIRVRVLPKPQLTCLQQLLLDVSWNANKRELYQPIDSPELGEKWQLVRKCTDRFEMMKRFLSLRSAEAPRAQTYLDIACNYGWFVKSMQELGYKAEGLEVDWAAREIGNHFYHLRPDQLIPKDVVRFFRSGVRQYNVVSCFSLLHHFVMGRGAVDANQLIEWLDQITKDILFIDMGDENEAWLRARLSGWNPDSIRAWIESKTTFREVIPLGTDHDRAPPFEENYGRTLFACVR